MGIRVGGGLINPSFKLVSNKGLTDSISWSDSTSVFAYANAAYSYQYTARSSLGNPVTYSVTNGSLPGALTLTSGGLLSGHVNAVVANTAFTYTVEATDGTASQSQTFNFTAVYNPAPTWVTGSDLGSFSEVANIAIQLTASDIYDRSITYSVANGSLPAGITVASNGLVHGQLPVESSNTAFTFGVAASNGYEANTQVFNLEVLAAHTFWHTYTGVNNSGIQYYNYPTYLQGQTFDSANSITAFSTIGNPLTYYCANIAVPGDANGVVPSGMSLDSTTGLLSGTIPSTGSNHTYGFEVIVQDTITGITANEIFYITAEISVAPTWNTPAGVVYSNVSGSTYSVQLNATSNDFEPVLYTLISGALPPGGTFTANAGNGNASVSGTLQLVSNTTDYSFTVEASDGVSSSTRTFTIVNELNQAPVWNTNAGSLGSGYESKPFSTTLSATDVNGLTVTYSLANATSLPSGMTLTNTGLLSGSFPAVANAQAGNVIYNFTIAANNGTYASNRDFSLTDMPVLPPVWTSNSLGTFYANAMANIALPVSDPQNFNMTFSTVSGTAPAGLVYGPGYMTGNFTTTAQSIVYSWTARANDGVHYSDEPLTATVEYLAPIWSTSPGSLGTFYENYNLGISLNSTDPNGGYPTYTVANGSSLPPGLLLDSVNGTGSLHGETPVVNSTTTYNFSITSHNAQASTEAFSLTVLYSATPTWVSSGSLGYFYIGNTVSTTLVANSASGNPLSYTVSNGSLPAGLTLANTTGLLSGTLSNTIANYSFTVTAADTLSQKAASQVFTMNVVSPNQPIWNLSSPQDFYVYANTPISIPLSITNPAGVSYSVTTGSLPNAVTITNDANFASVTTLIHADDALGSTTVADTSGYNVFTLANASISYANQKFGVGSINTANAGAVVTSSQKEANGVNFGTGAFTLEAWIYPQSLGQDVSTGTAYNGGSYVGSILNITGDPAGNARGILDWTISGPTATGNATVIGLQAYNPSTFQTNAIVDIYANAVIPSNQWSHVAVTRNGPSVTFFVNGQQLSTVYSIAFSGSTAFNPTVNSVIQIGGINGSAPFAQNLGGYIDEIRISNGVSRYINSFTPQTASYPTYVTLQGSDNAINGTVSSFTLTANNAGMLANLAVNLHAVSSFPTWTSNTTLTAANARQPYSTMLSGVTDPEGYTDFTFTNTTAMPGGLSVLANGLVTGTAPYANGVATNYNFSVKAANPAGPSVTQTITLPVNPVGIIWNTGANIGTFTVNSAISNVSLSVTDLNDGAAVITYTVANATSLPAGLTLSNGVISGTPSAVANTTFVLEAADIYNAVAFKTFYSNVVPGTITFGTSAFQWTVNTAISNVSLSSLATNTDHAPVNAVLSNATTLPTGLTLTNNVISGTPTVIANSSFTVHATDTYGASAYQTFNTVVWPQAFTWTDPQTPSGYETAYYSYQLTANDGQPLTYSLSSGALPLNLTLAANGLVSGALSNTVNVANYVVQVTDGHQSTTRSFSFSTLNASPVWITAPALGTYTSGSSFNVQLQANTVLTNAPITYTLTSGALPSGISLTSGGLLSGTMPIESQATGFNFTIAATANTLSTPQTFSLTVAAGAPTWTSNASLSGYYQKPVSYHLTANSPSSFPLTYSISNGALPGNLLIGNDPYWSNVATLLHFDDPVGNTGLFDPAGNTWTINNANIATSPSEWGNAIFFQGNVAVTSFTNTGVNPANANFAGNPFTLEAWIYPISWGTDTAATAPSNGGTIVQLTTGSGSGNTRGSWNFFAAGSSATANATTLNMQGWNPATFSNYPIIDVYANTVVPLNQWSHVAVTRSNATTFNFFLNGTLLTTNTRTNSGNTPALTANSVFMYGANSSLQIGGGGAAGFDTTWVGYMDELRVTNSVARYTTSFTPQTTEYVANGYLQSTMLNAAPGSYTFTTRATDNTGLFADQITTLNVSAAPITWTDSQTPSAYETSYYSYQLTANNGLPITYSLNSGSLPASLTLASNGLVSGVLSNTVNTANYVIAATDTYQTTTRSFTFSTLDASPVWVSNSNLGSYGDMAVVNTQLVATTVLTNAPISYAVTGGTLPTGITLSNTGLLSGTLPGVSNATGYSFTITATANTIGTPQTFALSEGGPSIVWTSNASLTATHGVKTDFPLTATDTGGNYPITYSISNGSLPSGYSINYGSNVTAMLHFEDPLANTVVTDSSGTNTYKIGPGGKLSNAVVKFGNSVVFGNGLVTPGFMANSQSSPSGVMFGTRDMTMEAWVYPQSMSRDSNFSGQLSYIGPIMTLYETTAGGARGVLNFYLAGSANNVVSSIGFWGYAHSQSNGSTPTNFDAYANTVAITMNAWNHVAVTRSGANINFWINGNKQTTQYRLNIGSGSGNTNVFTSAINIPDANTNLAVTSIQVGGWSGGSGSFNEILTGYIDEFRITNGVAQYTANFTPLTYAFVPQDISGSNSTTGTYTFTAKATDTIGGTANQVTTITIV